MEREREREIEREIERERERDRERDREREREREREFIFESSVFKISVEHSLKRERETNMICKMMMMMMLSMVTAQQMTGIYENQTQITKRPYVFTSSFCPTFPTYNETYDLNWDGHEISSAEECLFAVMNLTGGGGLNPVKVFDASTLRYSNLTWLHDAGQPQLSQEPFLFPCGCYLYHGPQHDEMYEWWNELESPAASHVAPDPWTFGSEDSYIFAFYAGGEKSGSLADGNYDPMCSINDENHFTKQLDWMNVCLGPNTLDSCSCSDCVRVVFNLSCFDNVTHPLMKTLNTNARTQVPTRKQRRRP